MYQVQYGNAHGVTVFKTSNIKYISALKAYLDNLGGYRMHVWMISGETFTPVDVLELIKGGETNVY